MRFKVWFDKFTNTFIIDEDDSGYALLALLVLGGLFFNAIITFLTYLAVTFGVIYLAKKTEKVENRLGILAVGSAGIGIYYCYRIVCSILLGVNSTAFIIMLQLMSIATSIYAANKCVKETKLAQKASYSSEMEKTKIVSKCRLFKNISIISLAGFIVFFSGIYMLDIPFPEEVREKKEQAEIEKQIAESVSIWELDIVESDAIRGDNAKYDSHGNLYKGEYREFCAWNYPSNRFEPHVIVDVNEKYDYTRFTGTIFTRPKQKEGLTIVFEIYADDRCIYSSGDMDASTEAIELDLDISGVDKLKFVAFTDDHASTNPAVILENAMVHAS